MRMNSMKTNYARTGLVLPVLLGCLLFTLAFMYFTPQSFAIVNGTEVPEITVTPMTFPMRSRTPRANPIRFTVEILLEGNDGITSAASGVLISPDLVATSAHNFTNPEGEIIFKPIAIRFFETANERSLTIPAPIHVIHPEFVSFANTNDIALIKLSVSITDDYRTSILLPNSPLNLSRGEQVYVAGLGINNLLLSTQGILKEAVLTYGNLSYGSDKDGKPIIIDEFVSAGQRPALGILQPIYDGMNAPQMICYGDSGGPAYISMPAANIPGTAYPVRASLATEPKAILYGLITKLILNYSQQDKPRFTGLLDIPASTPQSTNAKTITCEQNAGITVISNLTNWIVSTAQLMGAIPPTVENPPAAATVPAGSKTK